MSAKPEARPAARAPRNTAGFRLSYCAGDESLTVPPLGASGFTASKCLKSSGIARRPDKRQSVVFFLIGNGWLSRNERQDESESNLFLNRHEHKGNGVSVGGNLVPHKTPFHLKILHAHKVRLTAALPPRPWKVDRSVALLGQESDYVRTLLRILQAGETHLVHVVARHPLARIANPCVDFVEGPASALLL